ncbi:T9SS type B sorting domain-containing protein, partial [Flavobacterium sp. ov086]|uniref:T9SS type B sorting domain-containing protein n=1 Tax=Flavobacterium sp. ov086 TaxID=1761785 RepID=UPI000B6CB9B1
FSTNNVFNVGPGTYTVWVKDGNLCPASAPAVTVYDQLTAGTVIKELDCSLTPNATITVTPSGGLAPYKYEVSTNGGTSYSAMASNVYSTAVAGTFKIKVTDANLCTVIVTETILSISNPTASIVTQSNVSCNGKLDGSVTIKGTGGSGGFTYSKAATSGFGPSATFTGLGLGDYTFYVKDSKGCIGSIPVKITEPNPLVISSTVTPFACSTTNTNVQGKVVINPPAGGTSPFQYSFNGGGYSGNNTLLVDDNGTTDVTVNYSVKDANGCITTGSVTLFKLNPPVIDKITPSAITCLAGATTSTVTVDLVAGTGVVALKYETIAPSQAIIAQQSSNSFTGLAAGSYTFKVTDANGCFDTKVITINTAVKIAVSGNKNNDVKCKGGSTGNGTFTISNVATPGDYTFVLTAGTLGTGSLTKSATDANVLVLKDVAVGTYTVEVTSISTGCKNTATITIGEPLNPLTANLVQVNGNCKVGTSAVTINAAGGTLAYKYAFVLDGAAMGTLTTSNTANLDPALGSDWDGYVVDANGCQVKFDIKIVNDAVPTVTATATNQCLGVGTYTITASALGKGPFTYSINGTSFDTPNTFTVTTAGTYNIWAKDANGCIAKTTTPVTVYDKLTITPIIDKDITCTVGLEAAKVTLTIGGGSGSYSYSYTATPSTAVGTFAGNVFTTNDAADYIFTVKDDVTNCTATIAVPVSITTPTLPHFTAPIPAVLGCNGDASGSLTINIDPTQGVAPFVIKVKNKTTGQDYGTQTSGLPAAIYVVTVTDAKGCFYAEDIEIKQPDPIVIDYDTEDLQCIGGGVSQGKIIINSVTGGTPLYDYYVTGINGYNKQILDTNGSYTFEVVDFGLYQIRVVDANGCSVMISDVTIAAPPNYLDIDINLTASCGTTGGTANVKIGSAFPSAGPFHFNIFNGGTPAQVFVADGVDGWQKETSPGSKSTIFTNLTPGVTYTFIVYDEITKCYYYQTAKGPVPTSSLITIEDDVAHNITCTGLNNGNVDFVIKNNYSSPITVSYLVYEAITNKGVVTPLTPYVPAVPAVPEDLTAVPPVVGSPYIPATAQAVTATIAANGSLTVTNFGPLPVGNYYILVKEEAGPNAGCAVVSKSFEIKSSPVLLKLTASATSIADCNNLGTISAQAKDGTAPYTYQVVASGASPVDADWKTPNTFTRPGSVAGIVYDVYTKDAFGCIQHVPVTVYKYEAPKINLPAPICYDGNQFTISITGFVDPAIVGGATYSVDGSAFQVSPNFKFNGAKVYKLYIKDGKGCTDTVDYEVKPQLKLDVDLTKDIDCSGTPDAKITLTASGGFGPTYKFEYSTNNGGSWTTMPGNVLDTSVTGNYIFKATDNGNTTACSVEKGFTLDPIPTIAFTVDPKDVTCFGDSNGTITVNVTSGTGPYEYQLEQGATILVPFQGSSQFKNLLAGNNYVVRVKDAKQCTDNHTATVGTPALALSASSSITAPLNCTTGNAATKAIVTVKGIDGTSPYQYSYDGGLTYTTNDKYETYAGIKFDVYVMDANGCKFLLKDGIDVPKLNAPTDMDISGTLVFCQPVGRQTSTVTIDKVYNGVGTPQYEILSPIVKVKQPSNVFAGLAPSNDPYVFQVTDANGCTYQESYIVKPAVNITVSGTVVSDVTCNPGSNGEVLFTVGNFKGTYSYVLNAGAPVTGQTSKTISITGLTAASTQSIVVTDEVTGCIAPASVNVIQNPALSLSLLANVPANCDNKAKVQVKAAGGVAPYEYSFVAATATGPGTYTTSDTAFLDATVPNWKVYVKDANGCEITAPFAVTITKDAAPVIAMPASICYVGSNVIIDLNALSTVAVGPAKYTLNGVEIPGTTYTVTGAGTYIFGIIDGNGCKSNQVSFVVKPQVFLQADLNQDLTCAVDATIKLTPRGGTGTYNLYEVDINGTGYNAFTTLPYVATVDGTYTFRVTDSQGCPAVSNAVIVTPKTVPKGIAVATKVSCFGDSNGSIVVTASNGIEPYKYRIVGGIFQDSNIFKGLAAGPYNIEVKDAKECISVLIPVTVGAPAALSASSLITTKLECSTGNAPTKAEVTITGIGGTTPYQFSYDGGLTYSTDNTYETYAGIKFDVYVMDNNGCKFLLKDGVDVPKLNAPTDMDITGTLVFCQPAGRQTSTVTISNVKNGVGTPQFEILSPIVKVKQTSNVFAGLAPNNAPYVFQVTDANGCTYQESYIVKPAVVITVSAGSTTDASCNGGANGSAKFNVDNFTGTYSAALIAGTGTVTIVGKVVTVTGLVAGTYTLEVTDDVTGCKNTATIKIGEPAVLDVKLISQTAANCYSGAIVKVQGIGGTPVYKYAFVVSGATPGPLDYTTDDTTVLDFAKGPNWDVYVQDGNLICSNKLAITITKDDAPTIDVITDKYCYTGGPVPIKINGKTDPDIVDPPMYSIGNGYYLSPNFTLNAPGTYDFYIKDGNGCIAHAKYTLKQELLLQATLVQDLNCTTNDATITLLATQGTGTYPTFQVSKDGAPYTTVTSPYKPTAAGTYTFKVNDGQCDAVSVPVIITPITTSKFTTTQVNVRCKGDSNGSITVTASNGVAPYEYSIDGAAFGSLNVFSGLKAGTYSIVVRDAKKCPSLPVDVTITEPETLKVSNAVTPFTCSTTNTAQDAFITLTATDGTTPYSYSFDNGQTFGTSPVHIMNAAGTINYVVVDFNGCRVSGSAIVVPYTPPTKFVIAATPIYCKTAGGFTTISVDPVTIVGGVAPYKYAIISPAASVTAPSTVNTFAGLLPNTYVIEVTDANGCSTTNSIIVKKASEISVDAQLLNDVLCNGGSTGSIAFTVSNYITANNYDFGLNPNNGTFTQTGDVITYTGLTAGKYTFTVTDRTSGCTDSVVDFEIKQPSAALAFTTVATNISCNNKNATITVTVTGGTPSYGYAAVVAGKPAPTTFSADNKIVVDTNNGADMVWDVYVKDLNGCSPVAQQQTILVDPLPSAITASVTSQCASPAGTYEFIVSATGVAPLQYSIGGDFQTDPKFVVTVAGSYDITVKDANGCTTTVNAAVVIEDALDLQVETKALPSCDFQDGIVIAKATGGSGSYKYTSGAYIPVVVGTTATFNNMPAGTHTILVRDLVYGCTDTVIVELKKATEITGLSLTGNDVSCNGGSDGLIIVNLDPTKDGVNDNPVYTYTLTGTTISGTPVSKGPQESNVFDNLQAGDYTVLVTSGRGCHAQVDKRIKEPKAIVVDAPIVTSFNCTTGTNAVNFATITVNSVNGGSGKYVRYEFSKNGTVVQNTDSNVYTEYNLAGGSYTVRVFDDKGCEGSWTTPIIIDSFITMDKVNVAIVKPITCLANETIQVSVTTTGGTPALLSYTLTGVNGTVFSETNSTGLFKDLAIGNYKITVFNATTGCTITDFHYVFDPNTFAINVEPLKGKLCYGDADGSVNLTFVDNQLVPTNDAGPFSYVITGPVPSNGTTTSAGPILVSGLKAGVYTVTATLTDINGPSCTVTNTFTIDQAAAPLAVTKTQSEITCLAGNKDGIITASATGGWPGDYLYELRLGTTIVKGYSTSPVFENLTAGDYTVYVKDGLGCEAFVDAKLTNPKPIDIQISATPMLTCFDNEDGVVTVDVITGGSGNYTYTLNGVLADGTVVVVESQGTKQFIGLKAGTYTVTAKDTWGCENISNKVVIDQPTKVKAELTIARNETCQLVPILKITATGGKAPYYYSADGTNYSASFNSTIDITLPKTTVSKDYQYFVKDQNGCVSTVSNIVNVPVVPKLDFTTLVDVDIKCKGSAEGTITAVATGGLGNYVYTLQDAAGVDITPAPTQLTPGVFTGLAVGNYRVKLESSDCSVTSAPIEISQPNVELSAEAIPTNVTCNGFNNGKITVNAAGGTGVYKYAIEPEFRQFFDKNVFENLKPGFYDVLVQDENECYIFIKDVEVKEPAPLTGALVDGTLFPETCAGEKDGSFSVILSGGTLDYSVSLDSETGPFTQGTPGQTTFDFDNLSGGPHIVYFVDASGCNNQVDIAMDYAVTLNPTNEVSYDCVNNAASNMVTVDPGYDGDHSEIDYSLDGGPWQMNNIYTGLTPGDHTIKVRHTNGCTADTSFNIKVVNPLLLTLSEEKGVWNVITATATGGSGDYEYSIDGINFSSENKFTIYRTDTYTITVRDKNGCTHAESIPVKYVDVCLPNYFTPDGTYYTGWGPGCTNIYTNLIFSIFDRYGREIAKYHYGQKWDGRYNGEELPSGDYWYVLKLNDEKDAREFVGHFTLYR